MRHLALLQCNMLRGELMANARKLSDLCARTPRQCLCIAPQEALAGPNMPCLAMQPDFAQTARAALELLAASLAGQRKLLAGLPDGSSFLVEYGNIQRLPAVFELDGQRIGLNTEESDHIALNISTQSRPFYGNGQTEWELILSGITRQAAAWSISVNLCGGYGQRVYNGQSVVIAPNGSLAARAAAFAEDCLLFDLDKPEAGRIEPLCADEQEAQWRALTMGVADFLRKHGVTRAIIGLSGGMDSTLVACIATDAIGAANVTGVLMPSRYTSAASIEDALSLAQNLGIKTAQIGIEPLVGAFDTALAPGLDITGQIPANLMAENLQARIRGVLLMALANASGAFVLNTSNKSEACVGYSTLYGDTVGALAVIGDLFKTQVYQLADWFCRHRGQIIPQNIFDRPPSAELAPDQKDSDTLPPYDELDADLAKIISLAPEIAGASRLKTLRQRVSGAAFKRRQSPPALLISGFDLCAAGI